MTTTFHTAEFLRYMPAVALCERSLRELNFAWRLIESTAKMVCPAEAKTILPTMKVTREGFNTLEQRLIANLVEQNIAKTVREIDFKAKVIIDIVVRNLFERTADVGFLAMDDAIRSFILACREDAADDDQRDDIVARLRAYREKYTVYDEILILDTQGRVLANLDRHNDISQSYDPLVGQTLKSDHYVETFALSDLRQGGERALIYSHKIVDPANGDAIGILCLCFPIAVEMKDVFSGLQKPDDRSVMLMLDEAGCVISSSDPEHVAPGRTVPLALDDDYQVIAYGGREYLARTRAAHDYQGYGGPGWYGHVMIPCEMAFRQQNLDLLAQYDSATRAGVMSHAKSFCPPLHDVTLMADAINHSLRRVVWNGKIMSSGEDRDLLRLKSILHEISQTGDETNAIFRESIQDLYGTVLSATLQDMQFISRLMIDIMDRSLYERANDCRWWALTPDIRRITANGQRSEPERQRMTSILASINALYTAYSRLVVFDAGGAIIAASDPRGEGLDLSDVRMDEQLLRKTMQLADPQQYCVSPFEPSPLYGDRATYIYCAAIFDPQRPGQVVGGIGVVFDAETEFNNMLSASLPENDQAFAAYVDRSGAVISSTHPAYPPASILRVDAQAMEADNGCGSATIRVHDRQYMVAGSTVSFGYREYKNSDGHVNDVIAVVLVPIGAEAEPGAALHNLPATVLTAQHAGEAREFATVTVDGNIFALPAGHVVESIETERMLTASTLKPVIAGALNYQDSSGSSSAFVPVIDMRTLLHPDARKPQSANEIVVVRHGRHTLGLLVDDLHDVLEFGSAQIDPPLKMFHNRANYICNMIRTADPGQTVQVVDIESIVSNVFGENVENLMAGEPHIVLLPPAIAH
ncbi:chemotaxis protein CheW [Herbaspirillum sp. alder98]|uniref:chemotaxis protein CheW n=1 Tax=Herbaspirillum sp. alder98 TaxID=2913096 RepID=UPI001CD832C0|nr:chemotaxis protein CheW [Herbaspirillum sp. alder98]MCA1325773.1 chemotaxis protein CheW [Herbaspirillum sp. alder98]